MARAPDWKTDDDQLRLYHDDAMNILPTLAGCLSAVIVDIPYDEVNRDSGGLRTLDKGVADVLSFTNADVVRHAAQLADSVYVFCGIGQVSELRDGFETRDMSTRLCIWEKTNPSPMNGQHFWLSSIECCIFARKAQAYFSEHCASAVWRGPIESDPIHTTQKPIWLMERLVKASVPPNGICLDFCFGSATTAIACIRTGRRFIGIEKDDGHFHAAIARLIEELSRTILFEPTPKIIQKALPGLQV